MKLLNTILCASILTVSCKKEGTGGRASISGVIYEVLIDHNGDEVERRVAQDKKVFISYGDNTVVNDDVDSDGQGEFKFDYLTRGDYTISAYSDCIVCSTEEDVIEHSLTVSKTDQDVKQDIVIRKVVDPEDGSAMISGTLMIQKYLGNTPFGDPFVAQDEDVFIKYGSDEVHFEKTETGADGRFMFRELIKGSYTIYAYSTCDTCVNVLENKQVTVEVTSNGQIIDVGELITETP